MVSAQIDAVVRDNARFAVIDVDISNDRVVRQSPETQDDRANLLSVVIDDDGRRDREMEPVGGVRFAGDAGEKTEAADRLDLIRQFTWMLVP